MKTVIHIKTDKKLKDQADKLAEHMGFSLGTLINAALRQFVHDREVHFSDALRPSPYLQKVITEVESDLKTGKNMYGPFADAKSAAKFLRSKAWK